MKNMELEQDIAVLRESGQYPIVHLEIFETIASLKINDYVLEREAEVCQNYQIYLENVLDMKENKQNEYLMGIKIREIMDTQLLEREDSYLLALYLQQNRECAMDYLLKQHQFFHEGVTRGQIIASHQKLLEGTSSSQYAVKEYRTSDTTFVSKSGRKDRLEIHYFALPCCDIEEGIMNLCIYYNSLVHEQYTFIKSCLIHGLTGALQMFDDGNTRMGRMLQNVKIYELTVRNLKCNLSSPILYSSKSYFDYREQYRRKLGEMAICPSDEAWNEWIGFNLNRLEDQIYYANTKLLQYKKM